MRVTMVPVRHLDCGCIVATDTAVIVFAFDECADHDAGRTVPPDPRFAEWHDLGEVGA